MSSRQPGHQIRNPGSGSRNRYPCFSRHQDDATCDEGCILLMTADHGLDGGIAQSVEYLVDLCAGHSKGIFCATRLKHSDKDIGTCHCLRFRLCFHLIAPFGTTYSAFWRSFVVSTARFSFKNDPVSGRRTSYSQSIWIPTHNALPLQSSTCPPLVRSFEMK